MWLIKDKHEVIYFTLLKAKNKEIVCEFVEPCLRGPFKAINDLLKLTNMVGICQIDEARRLLHEDLLLKRSLEKGIGYV